MVIKVQYKDSTYLPVWFYDYTFGIVSVWEWLAPKDMDKSNFRKGHYEY